MISDEAVTDTRRVVPKKSILLRSSVQLPVALRKSFMTIKSFPIQRKNGCSQAAMTPKVSQPFLRIFLDPAVVGNVTIIGTKSELLANTLTAQFACH